MVTMSPFEHEIADFLTTVPRDSGSWIRLKDLYTLYFHWAQASDRPEIMSKRRMSVTLHALGYRSQAHGRGGFTYVPGLRHS